MSDEAGIKIEKELLAMRGQLLVGKIAVWFGAWGFKSYPYSIDTPSYSAAELRRLANILDRLNGEYDDLPIG